MVGTHRPPIAHACLLGLLLCAPAALPVPPTAPSPVPPPAPPPALLRALLRALPPTLPPGMPPRAASPPVALPPSQRAVQDDVRTALKSLERAWKGDIVAERLAALSALSAFDDPRCVDALLGILERGEAATFPAVRRVLGGYSAQETLARMLDEGLSHRDAAVRAQVLVTLGDARPGALDWVTLTEAALDDPLPRVRAAAVRALGRARAGGRLHRILELAGDEAERVRMEVPAALARLAGERAQAALDGLLRDPRWRVRLAVAQALADIKTRASAGRLVDAFERETGRLREDMVAMLERLTGRALGADAAAWREFLASAPDDFLSRGDAVALHRLGPPTYAGRGVAYHTINTASQRFVLLTDLSGSMDTPMHLAGRDAPRSRLDVTRAELVRLIEGLDRRVALDLVTFRETSALWKPRLVRIDERTRRAALREVDGYRAHGGTNIHGALADVFDMAERALDSPLPSDEDLDTLFLLSDGVPTEGAIQDPELLLLYAIERNRTLRLRIHCVSLSDEPPSRDFLRRLADVGDGHYVEVAGER
jgi:HEAT repeat protein